VALDHAAVKREAQARAQQHQKGKRT
jgi:hypothetical protein